MSGGSKGSSDVPETAAERALSEVSAGKWKQYQDNYVPLENQYMKSVDALGNANNQQRTAQMAQDNVQKSLNGMQQQTNMGMFARGIDPSSGQFQTKSVALNQAMAKTKNNAYNQGMLSAQNAYTQGLGNVVAMGNGQDTASFNGTRSLADQSARTAMNDAQRDFNKQQGDNQLAGQVIGAGVGYGMNSYFNKPVNNIATGMQSASKDYGTYYGSSQNQMLANQNQGF